MSRTYRRTRHGYGINKRNYEEHIVSDWVREKKHRWKWTRKALMGHELQKSINIFHSDGYRHMNHVPTWFVRDYCNKPFRAKMKQEIRNIMKRGDDYLDYNFNPNKSNALWNWW